MRRRVVKAKHQVVARLEAELLRRLRSRGGMSRVELARELHLVPSTAGIYVDRLVREGFLVETAKVARTPGRPATLVTPNPAGGQFVGGFLSTAAPTHASRHPRRRRRGHGD
jgi:N-acetylglucosamine repressor